MIPPLSLASVAKGLNAKKIDLTLIFLNGY
jgi:hypothetical protein